MVSAHDLDVAVSSVLLDLDAVRKRVDRASEWFNDPDASMAVAALARQVENLCHQASCCGDPLVLESLLAESRRHLDDLQVLLGVH